MNKQPICISKSDFINYQKCPRLFYLHKHQPEDAIVSDFTKMLATEGTNVGLIAQTYFGSFHVINIQYDKVKMVEETKEALNNNDIENICEASFIYDDCYCAVDILHKVNDGYEIYEVKSVVNPNPFHYQDVSFQKYVLEKCGLKITKAAVLTINSDYIRGERLDVKALFTVNELNSKNELPEIDSIVDKIRNIETLPFLEASAKCKDCSYFNYCYKDLPSNNVFNISGLRDQHKYYNKGLITFNDVCPYLSGNQLLQVNCELSETDPPVNKEKLNEILNKLEYPLYYLDFETVSPVIPIYPNSRPNQKIIIQYSLHYQLTPTSPLQHLEYLADSLNDLRREVSNRLINDLGEKGSIIVYHKSFEGGAIKSLANDVPDLAQKLQALITRIFDLEEVFTSKSVYNRKMQGRTTIKYVLPAMSTDFEEAYHELNNVHNGTEAMTNFYQMLTLEKEARDNLRQDLLNYCCLDTLAMVEILKALEVLR